MFSEKSRNTNLTQLKESKVTKKKKEGQLAHGIYRSDRHDYQ